MTRTGPAGTTVEEYDVDYVQVGLLGAVSAAVYGAFVWVGRRLARPRP